jgi:N-methylhydantoinase B
VGGDAGIATGSSDGEIVRAPGALGGEPTPNSRSFLIRNGKQERIRGHRLYELKPGDIILKISGGGAGVGSPAEREPEKVRKDVANEFISIEQAREKYKVAIDPTTLEVDAMETARMRRQGTTA